MDTSRQWGQTVDRISKDHVLRYRFAEKYVTGRVLDAACGCGYGSKILQDKAASVVGVDASAEAIRWANEYYKGPQFIQGWIQEVPWVGEFETVVSLETIEHIEKPRKALEAIRKACLGRFIASVPNEILYPFKAETFSKDESPHFRHYTPDQFAELLESVGFMVEEAFSQVSKQQPEVVPGTEGRFLVYVCK